jgi:hypothetical protein
MSDPDRFWARVEKSDDCWEWRGRKTYKGYGATSWKGKYITAHRLAYILSHGGIPEGKIICHSCDNRACCNPAHLWAGSYRDNTRDMDAKGRRNPGDLKGEKHGMARLTEANVRYIRGLYGSGKYTYKQIAEGYRVSIGTIECICSRKTWRHV